MIFHFLSLIYAGLAWCKNRLYDVGLLDGVRVPQKVISVGNLTMGGTGKTPIVDLILTHFENQAIATALVSKNYKAAIRHTSVIDLHRKSGAAYYGDEAWMLAQKHPQVEVFVGPQKWYTLWLAAKSTRAKVIVVDDGFQHRALVRDLDIVLLDATAPTKDYEVLPKGRARESWSELKRAQILVLTKTNFADVEQLEQLRIRTTAMSSVLVVETTIHADLEALFGRRVLAFAGLAHPEQFEKLIRATGSVELSDFMSFADHHGYSKADIANINKRAEGLDFILTTEKDFVKLNPEDFSVPLRAIPLLTKISSKPTEFYATLDTLLR